MREKVLRWLLARIQKALGEAEPTVVAEQEAYVEAAESYAVDRKPRRVPWHIRRKELEAAARTKRNKREEMRQYL